MSGLFRVVSDWQDAIGSDRRALQVLRQFSGDNGVNLEARVGGVVVTGFPQDLMDDSVIRIQKGSTLVSQLYRPQSRSNSLFLTERCNSKCLMCSQPPREDDDSWRIPEIIELIELIDPAEPLLGLTGGEATLLGDGLCKILEACSQFLPTTDLHILTNGRLFLDPASAEAWVSSGAERAIWAVPVYGPDAALHDYIVNSESAFDETMQGLYQLARLQARVEIRIVLVKPLIERLEELSEFIWRRLPFAEHVAFMGLEPMGYAKRNRSLVYADPADYGNTLNKSVAFLANRGMKVSVFNLPLCTLPHSLWPFARKSISDWKNNYLPECDNCVVREFCGGFFASEGVSWRSRAIKPISLDELKI